jgi:hypothetical protein
VRVVLAHAGKLNMRGAREPARRGSVSGGGGVCVRDVLGERIRKAPFTTFIDHWVLIRWARYSSDGFVWPALNHLGAIARGEPWAIASHRMVSSMEAFFRWATMDMYAGTQEWPPGLVAGMVDERTMRFHYLPFDKRRSKGHRMPMRVMLFVHIVARRVREELGLKVIEPGQPPRCVEHDDCAMHKALGRECWRAEHPRAMIGA